MRSGLVAATDTTRRVTVASIRPDDRYRCDLRDGTEFTVALLVDTTEPGSRSSRDCVSSTIGGKDLADMRCLPASSSGGPPLNPVCGGPGTAGIAFDTA